MTRAETRGRDSGGAKTDIHVSRGDGSPSFDEAELLAIARANRVAAEHLHSQPFPVGAWVIVYGKIDSDGPRLRVTSGQVISYFPAVGDGELFVRDIWGDIERVRLHGSDDNDPDNDTVGPAEFFETWAAYELALETQFRIERPKGKK